MPDNFTHMMDLIESQRQETWVLSREGRPVAVIISSERYDSMVAQLNEKLNDQK